jgi:hypothetical protein
MLSIEEVLNKSCIEESDYAQGIDFGEKRKKQTLQPGATHRFIDGRLKYNFLRGSGSKTNKAIGLDGIFLQTSKAKAGRFRSYLVGANGVGPFFRLGSDQTPLLPTSKGMQTAQSSGEWTSRQGLCAVRQEAKKEKKNRKTGIDRARTR